MLHKEGSRVKVYPTGRGMNKQEFLDILKQSLLGEVSSEVIEQNIRYYEQYINSNSQEDEKKIINSLGDPRLIARTVIESDRAARQKEKSYDNQRYHNEYDNSDAGNQPKNKKNRNGSTGFYTNLTWRQKLTIAVILLIVLFFIFRLLLGPLKLMSRFFINCAAALFVLAGINYIGKYLGIHLPVNPVSVVSVGTLGLPGFILFSLLSYLF
jgi:pro-sigmaK processing inhibitor BofA